MPTSRSRGRPLHDPGGPLRDVRVMLPAPLYAALEASAARQSLPLAAEARRLLAEALRIDR